MDEVNLQLHLHSVCIYNQYFLKFEKKIYNETNILLYRVSVKKGRSHGESMEGVKENKKVLYHFANFAIVNELLIIKNRRISPAYWLMQARDEMRPPCQRDC